MFSPRGNPQARNLFNVLGHLQKRAGLELHVAMGLRWFATINGDRSLLNR